jgi:hypothetical protein
MGHEKWFLFSRIMPEAIRKVIEFHKAVNSPPPVESGEITISINRYEYLKPYITFIELFA